MESFDWYVGEIRMFVGTYAPQGWAFCDGSSLKKTDYPTLFTAIGNTYGPGSSDFFVLPDLRGRVPLHEGAGPGLTNRRCGQSFGEEKVRLDVENLTSHNHLIQLSADTTANNASPEGRYIANCVNYCTFVGRSVGSNPPMHEEMIPAPKHKNDPHQNMMPSLCVNFIIALDGIYPSQEGK